MDAGGFNFDLCKRNDVLETKGLKSPGFTKTGTTISGVIFKVSSIHRLLLIPLLYFSIKTTQPYKYSYSA
jgi:hypothetical protein